MSESTSQERAAVELAGSFTAAELESIIAELMKARASLQPAVAIRPPDEWADAKTKLLVQDDALFNVRTLVNGGLRIWLRNEGIGWLAFTLSAKARSELQEFLGKKPGHTLTAH